MPLSIPLGSRSCPHHLLRSSISAARRSQPDCRVTFWQSNSCSLPESPGPCTMRKSRSASCRCLECQSVPEPLNAGNELGAWKFSLSLASDRSSNLNTTLSFLLIPDFGRSAASCFRLYRDRSTREILALAVQISASRVRCRHPARRGSHAEHQCWHPGAVEPFDGQNGSCLPLPIFPRWMRRLSSQALDRDSSALTRSRILFLVARTADRITSSHAVRSSRTSSQIISGIGPGSSGSTSIAAITRSNHHSMMPTAAVLVLGVSWHSLFTG